MEWFGGVREQVGQQVCGRAADAGHPAIFGTFRFTQPGFVYPPEGAGSLPQCLPPRFSLDAVCGNGGENVYGR